ncbi:MAG: winged helix DNA-binding protein [Lachnospiraceae bacterium]|nr:winged helix DNA-binding protein [Lachnospiraceae bacterium]
MGDSEIEKLLYKYNRIYKENNDLYRGVTKALGVSDSVFWILYSLREQSGGATQSEICNMLYEPKQTVNSALKKMEAEGYITMATHPDRRRKLLVLTQKGEELAEKTADKVLALECSALREMSEADRQAFLRLFQTYTEILKEKISSITSPSSP